MDSKVPGVKVGSVAILIGMFLSFPNSLATQLESATSFDCRRDIPRGFYYDEVEPGERLQDLILIT